MGQYRDEEDRSHAGRNARSGCITDSLRAQAGEAADRVLAEQVGKTAVAALTAAVRRAGHPGAADFFENNAAGQAIAMIAVGHVVPAIPMPVADATRDKIGHEIAVQGFHHGGSAIVNAIAAPIREAVQGAITGKSVDPLAPAAG